MAASDLIYHVFEDLLSRLDEIVVSDPRNLRDLIEIKQELNNILQDFSAHVSAIHFLLNTNEE